MQIKAKELAPAPVSEPEPEEMVVSTTIDVDLDGEAEVAPAPSSERRTSDVVLGILAVFLLVFIVAMIVTFWVKGAVPDTLIQCTMGGGAIEAVVLAGIKVSKVFAGRKSGSDPPDGVG